jgi:hypothetical protein
MFSRVQLCFAKFNLVFYFVFGLQRFAVIYPEFRTLSMPSETPMPTDLGPELSSQRTERAAPVLG